MDEFSETERNLLQALQEDDSPSAVDAARIKERVLVGAGVATAAGAATTAATELAAASTTTAGASAATGAGLWKAVAVVAATAGIGGGVYSVVGGTEPDRPVTQPVEEPVTQVESHNVDEATPPEDATIPEVDEPPDEPSVLEAEETPAPAASSATQTPRKVSPTSTLAEEAALLSRAQGALQSGDFQTALRALNEHKSKFPRGVLAGEREAALSVARCKSGDTARGRASAERFIKNNPNSPMVQRLRAACQISD